MQAPRNSILNLRILLFFVMFNQFIQCFQVFLIAFYQLNITLAKHIAFSICSIFEFVISFASTLFFSLNCKVQIAIIKKNSKGNR